jgi:ribose-phosphate pyrophosphokinase
MSIELEVDGKLFEVAQFTFPGGEVQIKVPEEFGHPYTFDVHASIRNSDDFMALVLTMSVVGRQLNSGVNLHLHYFPYARQDRASQVGEAESMKVFAHMINTLNFNSVHVWDIHNEEMLRYIDNVTHDNQFVFSSRLLYAAHEEYRAYDYVVAPDKGALPKIQKKLNNINPAWRPKLIVGEKVRDPATGNITGTAVDFEGSLEGKRLLIIDDICDGGRTFVELAKVLRKYNPKQIDLYVTHGIFSKGASVFFDLVDNIYTTNSFFEDKERVFTQAIPTYIYRSGKFVQIKGDK